MTTPIQNPIEITYTFPKEDIKVELKSNTLSFQPKMGVREEAAYYGKLAEAKKSEKLHEEIKSRENAPKDLLRVKNALVHFGLEVAAFLDKSENKSLCISPLSLVLLWNVLLKNSKNLEEKKALLSFFKLENMGESTLEKYLKTFYQHLNAEKVHVQTINGAVSPSPFNETFSKDFKENFGEIFGPEYSTKKINKWASVQTKKTFCEIFPKNFECPKEKIALFNTISFKGFWEEPFAETFYEDFFYENGKKEKVILMQQDVAANYFETSSCAFLELPYQDEKEHKLSQMFFLPKGKTTCQEMLKKFPYDFPKKFRAHSKLEEVTITLPKLKIEYTFDVMNIFRHLNIPINETFCSILHKVQVSNFQKNSDPSNTDMSFFASCPTVPFTANKPYVYCILRDDVPLFIGTVKDASCLLTEAQMNKTNCTLM